MSTTLVQSLRERVLRASGWSFLGHLAGQVVRLIGHLVLARLLAPEAFGLMAIVYVLMHVFWLFSDFGLDQSLVRSTRGDDPAFLHTLWSVQVARGAVICALGMLGAFALSLGAGLFAAGTVYTDPQLPAVVAVFSLTSLLNGLDSTKVAQSIRHMRQKAVTLIDLSAQLVALVVMLAVAWATRSVWSLVAGALVSAALRTLLTHRYLPGVNDRLGWDPSAWTEIIGFGKWVILSSLIGAAAMNLDRAMLGALVDAEQLGLYAVAFLLLSPLGSAVGVLVGNVMYPALSEVHRDDPRRFAALVAKFQGVADVLVLGGAGILLAAGDGIVRLLYDARYVDAGWILSLLAIGAAAQRFVVMDQCYLVLGRPSMLSAIGSLRIVLLVLGIPAGFAWAGMQGAVIAIVISQFASWPFAYAFRWRHGMLAWRSEAIPLAALAVGWGLGYALQRVIVATAS